MWNGEKGNIVIWCDMVNIRILTGYLCSCLVNELPQVPFSCFVRLIRFINAMRHISEQDLLLNKYDYLIMSVKAGRYVPSKSLALIDSCYVICGLSWLASIRSVVSQL